MTTIRPGATTRHRILRYALGASPRPQVDTLTTEEPLEIRLSTGEAPQPVPISITMRTPGHDFELAAGFLFTEGLIPASARDAISQLEYCAGPEAEQQYNSIGVRLRPGVLVDVDRLRRHFYTSSSCGVCGKASLDALSAQVPSWPSGPDGPAAALAPETVAALPDRLRAAQGTFDRTGGLHAAGLFTMDGELLSVREDVGRHNALDKLIGEHVLAGTLPLRRHALAVSGRASFELVQKAAMAGIPAMVAIGAPSSLAVDAAQRFGMTLVGFARGTTFNVYTHPERIA